MHRLLHNVSIVVPRIPPARSNSGRSCGTVAFGHGSHVCGEVVCDDPVPKGRGGSVGIEEQQPLARAVLVSWVAVNGGSELMVAAVDFFLVYCLRSKKAFAHWRWDVEVRDVEVCCVSFKQWDCWADYRQTWHHAEKVLGGK